jgi:hypothetical protein
MVGFGVGTEKEKGALGSFFEGGGGGIWLLDGLLVFLGSFRSLSLFLRIGEIGN